MNLQTEINELKAELNELNRLKIQEASELADIEYDIYQMETNFLAANNPIRSLIIKGLSLSQDETSNYKNQKVLTSTENISNNESNRIFTKSSLTSNFALNKQNNKLTNAKVKHASSQIQIKRENASNLFLRTSTSLPINVNSENHQFDQTDLVKMNFEEMPYALRRERRSSLKRKM